MDKMFWSVQQCVDKMAIKETFSRYALTMDTGDADGFADVFTEDAVWLWETESFRVEFRGRGQLRELAAVVARSCPGAQHTTSNHVIDVGKGEAHAVCELMVFLSRPEEIYTVMLGTYDVDLKKVEGAWYIAALRVYVANPEILLKGRIGEHWAGVREHLLK